MIMPIQTVLFLAILTAGPVLGKNQSSNSYLPAFKLEIYKDEQNVSSCTYLSLIKSQLHKGIRDMDLLEELPSSLGASENGNLESLSLSTTSLAFYSLQLPLLWQRAESLCGPRTGWQFDTFLSASVLHIIEQSGNSDELNQINFASVDAFSSGLKKIAVPDFKVVPLFITGPSSNRVDITFFGDGYTESEREKFLMDARTLALDISHNHTFLTMRPVLNFWAAFAPSNETGIGVGGKPKDTLFGLYRDGTELRGVYYAKPKVAAASCDSLGDVCDYPILLGNDPLYGGLGGRFTVTTSSRMNGPLVLRHELGHSIINVGEEYDGGYAYFGPNAAHNLSSPFPWVHWLTSGDGKPRIEKSVMPMQAYPWTILSYETPWTVKFNSSGLYPRHLVRFSLSAIPEAKHLVITLDGEDIDWSPMPDIGVDRWHYDVDRNQTLTDGEHSLSFSLQEGAFVGLAQLCSAEIIEFGHADEFNASEGHISAYPTFSDKNITSYRPTNEGCLMRVVTSPDFCKVCVEGLWHVLLKRVNLIDNVSSECTRGRTISVDTVKLGQFRIRDTNDGISVPNESISINWEIDGTPMPQFENRTVIELDGAAVGNFSVAVKFITEEVRVDPQALLEDSAWIEVRSPCDA